MAAGPRLLTSALCRVSGGERCGWCFFEWCSCEGCPTKRLTANTPPSTIPTPADPPSSDATPVVDNSHASDGMVDYLFHALHPNEPNELSIRDVWTREDPVKTVRQLLHVTGVIHVLAASDSHTALSDGADAEKRPHRI